MFGIKAIIDEYRSEITNLNRALVILREEIITASFTEHIAILIALWLIKRIIAKKQNAIDKILQDKLR
jgi:hypothetical protein